MTPFPVPIDAYTQPAGATLWQTLAARATQAPFNLVTAAIFAAAVAHTFAAPAFLAFAHRVQQRHNDHRRRAGLAPSESVAAELLHFLGEVEVVFALWGIVLLAALSLAFNWHTAASYIGEQVNFSEPMFVVVIMALASTRPVLELAEAALQRVAALGGGTVGAWWLTLLTVGPLLGSFITEPGAMTICALLLARRFYELQPTPTFRYATLGLLFVNVSIGGALTHFAAPPILMVVDAWEWTLPMVLSAIGSRALVAVACSSLAYYLAFRRELRTLGQQPPASVRDLPADEDGVPVAPEPVPVWVTAVHVGFMTWTVLTSHYPVLFMAGFLFFLGFAKATAPFQNRLDLRGPLLVGFFLGGLVVHGGLQGWWIGPTLASLSQNGLFVGASILTAFNDNALITYLATLVPDLGQGLRIAVVQGAITGGGLTVIANAPNPAGQAILGRFFPDGVQPLRLLLAALTPTLIAAAAFRLL